jgi:hypothetical protein
MDHRTFRLVLVLICLAVPIRTEARPQTMDFQGCLTDSTGAPLADGAYAVRLSAYGDPDVTAPLWQSAGLINVTVVDGCFRHLLGTSNPLPDSLFGSTAVWVGIGLGSAPEQASRVFVEWTAPAPPADSTSQMTDSSLASPQAPKPATSAITSRRDRLPTVYAHLGASFGLGGMGRGDVYKLIVDPFKPTVGVGYTLGVSVGFRNIYQFQWRPRSVASVDLFASSANVRIPMTLHLKDIFIHKLNLFAFKKPGRGGMARTLFVYYGSAGGGSVRHVDEASDGFLNGSDKLFGLELGILNRAGEASFFLERHAITFKSFDISGVGSLIGDIEATFWYFGLQFGLGPSF